MDDVLGVWDGQRTRGEFRIEIPTCDWFWEEYHSVLNRAGTVVVPTAALCASLGLTSRSARFDLLDTEGKVATLFRRSEVEGRHFPTHLAYCRADLVAEYLARTGQELVHLTEGRRLVETTLGVRHDPEVEAAYQAEAAEFRCAAVWSGLTKQPERLLEYAAST